MNPVYLLKLHEMFRRLLKTTFKRSMLFSLLILLKGTPLYQQEVPANPYLQLITPPVIKVPDLLLKKYLVFPIQLSGDRIRTKYWGNVGKCWKMFILFLKMFENV